MRSLEMRVLGMSLFYAATVLRKWNNRRKSLVHLTLQLAWG